MRGPWCVISSCAALVGWAASAAANPLAPEPVRCERGPAMTVWAGAADTPDVRTRVSAISAAADASGAQLAFTAGVTTQYDSAPWELRLAKVSASAAAAITVEQPEDSAAAETPDPRAVAVTFGDRLGVFSHGLRDLDSFRLVPGGGVVVTSQLPSALAAASAGDRVLGASSGVEGCSSVVTCAELPRGGRRTSVRAHLVRARKSRSAVLYQVRDRPGRPAAPPGELAVALAESTAVGGAVAFVAGDALLLARTDAQGARRGDVETVTTGRISRPQAVFRGDHLVLVWVVREGEIGQGLAGMELGPGQRPSPTRWVALPTTGRASEPSLRAHGSALWLAWTETLSAPGASAATAASAPLARVVKLSGTHESLATLTARPLQISADAVTASAPALATVASNLSQGWIAWAEFPQKAHSGGVLAAQLTCR